ncbi:UPF0481 protein At3g47200-like [Magnolia sinica]|uniref:UPF0481 protein At3g47200-like n=1 Tax=Magnolia sinica TaxID=86752 RepID=UPI0026580CE9|nr:UPF0481 protein At3g47200-like [Magnolia sinica]
MAVSSSSISMETMALDPIWVSSLKGKIQADLQKLKASACSNCCSIYRVPHCLREADKTAYTPHSVSVGPFHHGEKMLEAMEQHKHRYLHEVLSRDSDIGLERYLMAIKELEQRARECYSETIHLNSNQFVEMMVVDGCFILQLLYKQYSRKGRKNDPIFMQSWLTWKLQIDLLMLDNQIPFCVLKRLFDLIKFPLLLDNSFTSIILNFFNDIWPSRNTITVEDNPISDPNHKCEIQHLLHLFHSSLVLEINLHKKSQTEGENESFNPFPCATKLREAGVKFKAGNASNFLDIKFGKGVIEIPPLSIEDGTNSVFLNLIAFEQCYSYCSNHITTYATFMDCLINSATDVGILCHNGIIKNWLGSDEEVADLFNKLGRDVIVDSNDFYLSDVSKGIDEYYRTPWHAWRASLMHKYFNNPWAIISLIGAVIFLVLTFIQTFFAPFSYFHSPS